LHELSSRQSEERWSALLRFAGVWVVLRNVNDAVVRELKKRAARRNHSAEQEHREILEQALLRPKRRSLAEVLAAMPDVGEDSGFERRQTDARR
jgi:plasmid stability protein